MEATCSSETSVDFQRSTFQFTPEYRTLHNHHCNNIKSYNPKEIFVEYFTPYICVSMYLYLYSPLFDLGHLFGFLIFYTVGRTPWAGGQPFARSLPAHWTAQTEETHTDIHALSGIRNHDPSVRAGEDRSCLRPLGQCDRRVCIRIRRHKIIAHIKCSPRMHTA
jgi:hypothetical protein